MTSVSKPSRSSHSSRRSSSTSDRDAVPSAVASLPEPLRDTLGLQSTSAASRTANSPHCST